MNKSMHVHIGKHLCDYVKEKFGIYLDRESFLFGNVLPDLCLNFMIRPHVISNYSACLQSGIQNLLNIKQTSALFGKSYSKQLGVICHYYADYFCYPHSEVYTGDIVSHVKYEKDLYRYLHSEAFIHHEPVPLSGWHTEADERMIFNSLSKLQENYLENKPSFENDISYSIKACTEVLYLITGSSLIEQTDEYELCYPA